MNFTFDSIPKMAGLDKPVFSLVLFLMSLTMSSSLPLKTLFQGLGWKIIDVVNSDNDWNLLKQITFDYGAYAKVDQKVCSYNHNFASIIPLSRSDWKQRCDCVLKRRPYVSLLLIHPSTGLEYAKSISLSMSKCK